MPRNNKEKIQKRNQDIIADFKKLCGIKEHNVQKYNHELILKKLTIKFYLEQSTIEKIIKRGW